MGDSGTWGRDKEDEDKTCTFGVVTKYFEKCSCVGCKALAERNSRIFTRAAQVEQLAFKLFRETPDEMWDSITCIKIKEST